MNDLLTVDMYDEDYEIVQTQVKRGTVIIDGDGDIMRLGSDDKWHELYRDGTFVGPSYALDRITIKWIIEGSVHRPVPSTPVVESPDEWTWAKIRMSYYGNDSTFIQQVRKDPDSHSTYRRESSNTNAVTLDSHFKIVELFPDIKIEDN